MRRRDVLAAAATVMVGSELGAAQEPHRAYRIGLLVIRGGSAATRDPTFEAGLAELARAGFIEGKDLAFERLGIADRPEQFPELAAALVAARVDIIYSAGARATEAAQNATRTIPIIAVVDDMIASGLVRSLARPGGNLTGISILATELDGKRQEILFELLPQSRRMAVLADPGVGSPAHLQELRSAASRNGVELLVYPVGTAESIAAAIAAARTAGATALNVLASPLLNSHHRLIFERSLAARLAAIYQWPERAREGGLIAYGPTFAGVYRQFAQMLIKLMRGAKPADLPIEQPTTFQLVINLKTAKALSLTVPPTLLARADEVIE